MPLRAVSLYRAATRITAPRLEKFGMTSLSASACCLARRRIREPAAGLRGLREEQRVCVERRCPFAAVASHYIQDAHQPLHATNNYNGQLTGNDGIHTRFERDLFERFESRLTIRPAVPVPITNPRDAAFDILLASHGMVDGLMKSDKAAAAGKATYDDDYYEKLLAANKPMLERQIAASITATAGVLIGAWEQAGKPALKTVDARPVQRVRAPKAD